MKKQFAQANNPLINPPALAHGAPPLDSVKPEHFLPAIEWALDQARARVAAIRNNASVPNFTNTIEALEFSEEAVSRVGGIFGNLVSTNGTDELRLLERDTIGPAMSRYANEIMFDEALFARVKYVYDRRAGLRITQEQKMLLENTYKGYVRNGALLPPAQKKRLGEINERLSRLGSQYSHNVLKATQSYNRIIDDEDLLDGVPQRAKDLYRHNAAEAGLPEGQWLIKLQPPPMDILMSAKNRALREEIWKAMNDIAQSGPHDNRTTVLEIVSLRDEKARLLGYPNYAEYVLSDRMAGSAKTVQDFLAKNLAAYRPAAEKDLKDVQDFARARDGLTDLKPWDFSFYSRLVREDKFKLQMEEVRPYFDLEKVLGGLFTHAEKLFDIKLKPADGRYPVYHPDVKVYEVVDNKTGAVSGIFYADYYARPGAKNGGAWMNSFRNRGLESGKDAVPLVVNVCNYAKPSKGQPTLLSLDEVTTLFHEFGHGLHGLLAEGRYPSLTGTNVKWDFVELPSQLMENWVAQKEVLDTFAKHFKTGQKIPADMIDKIRQMETYGAGYMGLRQTSLGLLDIAWHTADPATIRDVAAFENKATAATALFPQNLGGPMSTHFGHIFAGGYAAGYYSYKWAEVLEADVFERFKTKGLYDRKTADSLRRNILARGGTDQPMSLFRAFMGRDPDPAALFRREGLAPEKPQKKCWWPRFSR